MTRHSPDEKAGRKLEVDESVSRLIRDLAGLSPRGSSAGKGGDAGSEALASFEGPVGWLIEARRLRGIYFPEELASSPAWYILLELAKAAIDGREAPLSQLSSASRLPAANAARWLNSLEEWGLVSRRPGAVAGEDRFELTAPAARAFGGYLEELCATWRRAAE